MPQEIREEGVRKGFDLWSVALLMEDTMLSRRELEVWLGKNHIPYMVSEWVADVTNHVPWRERTLKQEKGEKTDNSITVWPSVPGQHVPSPGTLGVCFTLRWPINAGGRLGQCHSQESQKAEAQIMVLEISFPTKATFSFFPKFKLDFQLSSGSLA